MADNLNSKGNKRGMSEKSKKNLIPITERSENEQRKMRSNGGKKSVEVRQAKVERTEARNYIWNELYGKGKIQEILENGSTKDIIELIKALLPPEKQTQEIIGNITTQKIFITPDEVKETDKHINEVIEGES
jgi:hypothetical protein